MGIYHDKNQRRVIRDARKPTELDPVGYWSHGQEYFPGDRARDPSGGQPFVCVAWCQGAVRPSLSFAWVSIA